jgi:hypothetical protein
MHSVQSLCLLGVGDQAETRVATHAASPASG